MEEVRGGKFVSWVLDDCTRDRLIGQNVEKALKGACRAAGRPLKSGEARFRGAETGGSVSAAVTFSTWQVSFQTMLNGTGRVVGTIVVYPSDADQGFALRLYSALVYHFDSKAPWHETTDFPNH